ncbi:uncharacterized protein UTRI_10440_B [Ustilago trichophora]|uniref:Uncharacterized protein n=1 Tax=Ustilago trichophora TaxID=86804 RepID=A0A5C3EAC4_9BASI|nr:uncharacterized protein UTRI_10440_B [Ustilago trichophora]
MEPVVDKLSVINISGSSIDKTCCYVASGTVVSNTGGELSMRSWWQDMTGRFTGFSTEYLLDKSTPWSYEAYTHVFVDDPTSTPKSKKSSARKRREDIILAVLKRAMKEASTEIPQQPRVRFVDDEVLITIDDPALLESFWRNPPVYRGKELRLVSRGLPWKNVTVWGLSDGQTMSEQEVSKACRNFTGSRKDLINILAGFYEVKGMQGGPVFSGEVLVFWSNFCQRKKPKFNGQPLHIIYEDSDSESSDE